MSEKEKKFWIEFNVQLRGQPEAVVKLLEANHVEVSAKLQALLRSEAERLQNPAPRDTAEPGLPLRQFIRGFLRDHLGMSKIAAHLMADLFMQRWSKNDPETAKRYAREDQHTARATFLRKATEHAQRKVDERRKVGVASGLSPTARDQDPIRRGWPYGRFKPHGFA